MDPRDIERLLRFYAQAICGRHAEWTLEDYKRKLEKIERIGGRPEDIEVWLRIYNASKETIDRRKKIEASDSNGPVGQ